MIARLPIRAGNKRLLAARSFVALTRQRTLVLGAQKLLGRMLTPELKIRYGLENYCAFGCGSDWKENTHENEHMFDKARGGMQPVWEAFGKYKPGLTLLVTPLHEFFSNSANAVNMAEYTGAVCKLMEVSARAKSR